MIPAKAKLSTVHPGHRGLQSATSRGMSSCETFIGGTVRWTFIKASWGELGHCKSNPARVWPVFCFANWHQDGIPTVDAVCAARSIRKDRLDVSISVLRRHFGFRSRLTVGVTPVMAHLTSPFCCLDAWPPLRREILLGSARQGEHKAQAQAKVHLQVRAAVVPDREWAAAGANHPLHSRA